MAVALTLGALGVVVSMATGAVSGRQQDADTDPMPAW
jgi:hypothetical protein